MVKEYAPRGSALDSLSRKYLGDLFRQKRRSMAKRFPKQAYRYTQEMVAIHLGTTQNTIHRIEIGVQEPTLKTCYGLRDLYGITDKQWARVEKKLGLKC